MGAWGTGTFENDDAGDWTWELDDATDHGILEATLAAVTEADEQPESPDATNALAAAEVVAALDGKPLKGQLPDSVDKYLQRVTAPPSPDLKNLAIAAIKRIEADSELRDLWEETEDFDEWKATLQDLLIRLQG